MTTIYYNGENVFASCIGTPLVTMDVGYDYVNGKLSRKKTITLRAKIKKNVCTDGFAELYIKQRTFIDKFQLNYKSLIIEENGSEMFRHPNVIIRSVNSDENSYANFTTLTVAIDCYDYNFADNGILEPSDEIEVTNNNDGTQNISRNISCSSYNTTSHFMDNAVNFIRNPTATSLIPIGAILTSRQESINRHTGKCSISYKYIYDPNNRQGVSNRGILTYSISSSKDDDRVQVSVTGEVSGGMDCTMQNLRDSFNYLNWYNICSAEYENNFIGGSLGEGAISFSVTENISENIISFDIVFDNVSQKEAYIIDTTTITRDFLTGVHCISCRLEFVCDYGCKIQRWNKVNELYNATNIDDYALDQVGDFFTGENFSTSYKSKSVSFDEFNNIISTSVSFCNDYVEDCGCLKNFEYSMQFTPSITKYTSSATINGEGCYYIQNLGFKNRSKFSISGSYRPSDCCTTDNAEKELLSRINFITSLYFPAEDKIIDSKNIEYDEFGTVSFAFSFNGVLDFTPPVTSEVVTEGGDTVITEGGDAILLEG